MPRNKADYSYKPSERSPSERKQSKPPGSFVMPMNKPKGVSEITEYVETELAFVKEGETELDLIREFQEEVCQHSKGRTVIAEGPTCKVTRCNNCGLIERQEKNAAV